MSHTTIQAIASSTGTLCGLDAKRCGLDGLDGLDVSKGAALLSGESTGFEIWRSWVQILF